MAILPTTNSTLDLFARFVAQDVQRKIFGYLPPRDLLRCRLVSNLWKTIAEQIPRRPGGMLSIADQFSIRSLRQTLIMGPQKEEIVAQGFVPFKDGLTPQDYLQQAGFQIEKNLVENSLKLHVQNATTKEHLGIIDLSNQPPSTLPEENYLLSRLSPDELAKKYTGCYACQNNELITLFIDGTVLYWKMTEGQFVRTKVLRLDGIEILSPPIYQWKHFLLTYNTGRDEDRESGRRDTQLHIYDLNNQCLRPSISPLHQPIDYSLGWSCHKLDPSRLVIWTQSLYLPGDKSKFPAKVHYITLNENNSLHLKTIDLESILKSKIPTPLLKEHDCSFFPDLIFTNHGFILRLGRFLYVLTRKEGWLVDLNIPYGKTEALQEGELLILRNFWSSCPKELSSIEELRRCQLEKRHYLAKTMVIHLPSGEQFPTGKIDELAGSLYAPELHILSDISQFYPHLQNLHFLPDRKIMQIELANKTKTLCLEYNLDVIPKPRS